jgi:hypothetical protein
MERKRSAKVGQEIRESVKKERKAIEAWAEKQKRVIESWAEKEKKAISAAVDRGAARGKRGISALRQHGKRLERRLAAQEEKLLKKVKRGARR